MTVAAILLFSTTESALADAARRPAVRRMVESAWAGGATPIVVVSSDEGGQVAAALAGSPAVLAEPAPPAAGPVGQIVRGMRVASDQVRDTEGALVWPGRMVWVDAETVTTLIEASGVDRGALLQPRYEDEPGWPVLIPMDLLPRLAALDAGRLPRELVEDLAAGGAELRLIDTGDPGAVHDSSTAIDSMPDFEGPPKPLTSPPEWGAAAADMGDEGPLQGPALAPYGQATEEGE